MDRASDASTGPWPTSNGGDHWKSDGPVRRGGSGGEGHGHRYRTWLGYGTTTTNSDGIYDLPQVPIGTYNIKVEHTGFQAAQQSNITLVLNQVARLDFQLKVGDVSTSVNVTEVAPLLQTDSTQVSTVMDAHAISEPAAGDTQL